MARQTSRPGMMIVSAVLFLAIPFLWAKANNAPVNRWLLVAGILLAANSLYLATRYARQRRADSSTPPAA